MRIDNNISEFSDESLSSVSVLTDSDLKILKESFNSKISNMHKEVTKSQNQMLKDLKTRNQNWQKSEQDQTTVKGIRGQLN